MRAGIPFKIAAKVDPADQAYFDEVIEPLLDHPLVEFIGEIDESAKCDFLGHALALLFPIDWPEPFGLVMIEAMSAGTPVIAFRNGSVPEVVADGVSWLHRRDNGRGGRGGPSRREHEPQRVSGNVRASLHGRTHGRGLCQGLRSPAGTERHSFRPPPIAAE